MSLIECSECGSQVSNLAVACPKCGAPVAQAGDLVETPLNTTQPKNKNLKLQATISGGLFLIGLIWFFLAYFWVHNLQMPVSTGALNFFAIMLVVGAVWYIYAKSKM
jgi:uncharacterized membrane protein YvbJ